MNKKYKRKYTFAYWFQHWCAVQMLALQYKVWKPSFLTHDLDKPLLNLFMDDEWVRNFHRKHSTHHNFKKFNINYVEAVIDWESARFTKSDRPLDAAQTLEKICRWEMDDSNYFKFIKTISEVLNVTIEIPKYVPAPDHTSVKYNFEEYLENRPCPNNTYNHRHYWKMDYANDYGELQICTYCGKRRWVDS